MSETEKPVLPDCPSGRSDCRFERMDWKGASSARHLIDREGNVTIEPEYYTRTINARCVVCERRFHGKGKSLDRMIWKDGSAVEWMTETGGWAEVG